MIWLLRAGTPAGENDAIAVRWAIARQPRVNSPLIRFDLQWQQDEEATTDTVDDDLESAWVRREPLSLCLPRWSPNLRAHRLGLAA